MKNILLKMAPGTGYEEAEKAARREAGENLLLLAWYDKARGIGAPKEACSLENWKCVRDYAEHHAADIRVSVNGDEYEFYFFRAPADVAELDNEEVEAVHEGISRDEFDNVQGG